MSPNRASRPQADLRKSPTRLAVVAVGAVSLSIVILGCNSDRQDAPQPLATVGGISITKAEVRHAVDRAGSPTDRGDGAHARREVLARLIQATWIKQEAQRLGVSSARNATTADLLAELHRKAVRDARPVLKDTAAAYYEANKKQYYQPESRLLDVVRTETRKDGLVAKAAIDHGASWSQAVVRYSTDAEARSFRQGTTGLVEGEWGRPIGPAVFRAPIGKTMGPVRAEVGWAIFRVRSFHPGHQVPFSVARGEVETDRREDRQHVIDVSDAALINRYKVKTRCGSGVRLPECKTVVRYPPRLVDSHDTLVIQGGHAYYRQRS